MKQILQYLFQSSNFIKARSKGDNDWNCNKINSTVKFLSLYHCFLWWCNSTCCGKKKYKVCEALWFVGESRFRNSRFGRYCRNWRWWKKHLQRLLWPFCSGTGQKVAKHVIMSFAISGSFNVLEELGYQFKIIKKI